MFRHIIGRGRRPAHRVRLYGKPGCHLCDDARATLKRIARHQPLNIEEVDISQDGRLFREYDVRIPVLVIDGQVELSAPVSERELRVALR